MRKSIFLAVVALLAAAPDARSQQVPDLDYHPAIVSPAHAAGTGPVVVIDEAHHNFHTATDRYRPFAELLRRDGYRVSGGARPLAAGALDSTDVLVIANALHETNANSWALPTPSAFTPAEIAALRAWVERGGALLLIADHMPFAGAAADLARAFGFTFSNGYAAPAEPGAGPGDVFTSATGLRDCVVTRGRGSDEQVDSVATFTGSAFRAPEGSMPVLVFGSGAVSRETTSAPGVTPDAPAVPVDGWCQGAIMDVGKGRLAVFGEAAMFTAQWAGPERLPIGMNTPVAVQNHQLLLNVVRWLTRAPGLRD